MLVELFFLTQKMTSIWKKVLDLTYPYTSMFTGRVVCDLSDISGMDNISMFTGSVNCLSCLAWTALRANS